MLAPGPASKATAHPTSPTANVVFLALSQVAGVVLEVGNSAFVLAPVLTEWHLADQVFTAMARTATVLVDLAIAGNASRDMPSSVLIGSVESSDAWSEAPGWHGADEFSGLDNTQGRRWRREASIESGPSFHAGVAALAQYFADTTSDNDADHADEE